MIVCVYNTSVYIHILRMEIEESSVFLKCTGEGEGEGEKRRGKGREGERESKRRGKGEKGGEKGRGRGRGYDFFCAQAANSITKV